MKPFGKSEESVAPKVGSGRSAEQFVALTLVGVCLVAGAGIWIANRDAPVEVPLDTRPATTAASATETSAVAPASNWQSEIDKQSRAAAQQRSSAEAESIARQERERQIQELERRKRELAAQAAALAAAANSSRPSDTPPARTTAAAPASPPSSTELAAAAPAQPTVVPARILNDSCDPPQYPATAERLQQEGQVVLGFQIDTQGRVIGQRVDKSSGYAQLDSAALRALSRCRFTPGTVDGVAQTAWTQVRFTWKLGR